MENLFKYISQMREPWRERAEVSHRRPEFEKPYLAPIQVIGGRGGGSFDFQYIESGATLEKIGVWAGDCHIRSIKVWLTNGKCESFGRDVGEYSEYTFSPGERITSLSLWDNVMTGAEQRLGAIKFKTTNERSFFSKMTDYELQQENPIDVGSGVCVGVTGRHGWHIDSLGFIFINPIKSCVLSNITYPTIDEFAPHVTIEEIKSTNYSNSTSVIQEFTLATTKKFIKTSSWSMSYKMDLAFSMTVKGTIPAVVEGEAGCRLAVGLEGSYSVQHSEEKEETVSVPIKVPPGKAVRAKVTIGRAVLDLPYMGDVKITCYNGSALEFTISGVYSGVTYTTVDVHMVERDQT